MMSIIKNKALIATIVLATVFHSTLQASNMGSFVHPYRFVVALGFGPAWGAGVGNQNLFLTPEIEKTYTQQVTHSALTDAEVFWGIQSPFRNMLQSQTGIAVGVTSRAQVSGAIWDDADPIFNNYGHSYFVQHTHLAVTEKLLADIGLNVMPWLSASLGVAWNESNSFKNTPTIPEAVTMSNFSNHTQNAFTYTLGVGVEKSLTEHWQIGMGYEFADWGAWNLSRSIGQTVGEGPGSNHLYTNGLLFNVTLIA